MSGKPCAERFVGIHSRPPFFVFQNIMQFALPKLTPKNVLTTIIGISLFIALWPASPFIAAMLWLWMKTNNSRAIKITITVFLFIMMGAVLPPSKTQNIRVQQTAQNALGDANNQLSNQVSSSTQSVAVAQNNNPGSTAELTVSVTSTQQQKTANNAPTPKQEADAANTLYTVASVIDGDTLKITMNGKSETLRLIGMDTPETVDPRKPVQCFGKEASNKAKELLAGKKISIEADPSQGERDKYGRLLVYVRRSDGLFYNKYMIEQGYAHEYTYNLPYKYQAEFKAAQKVAQEAQRGLWSPTTCSGDTTQAAAQPAPTVTTQPSSSTTSEQPPQPSSGGKYYTSSHYKATRYYPEECEAWKSLSPSYLKVFNSLSELLVAYPNRTLSPECN